MPTPRRTDDQLSEGLELRRCKNEARAVDRLDRQIRDAEELIGHLNSGKLYINLLPLSRGRIRVGTRHDLIAYLIRNRYV